MTDSRAARAARRGRRDLPEHQGGFVDVVDELLGEGGAAQALPPPIIPVVATAESSLDLPPNWQTGELPNLQAGVLHHLPPLPSSLGSISGRRSTPSGYTPAGGPAIPQPRGRGATGNRHAEGRNSRGASAQSGSSRERSRTTQRSAAHSAGYANVGSGEQRTGDLFEGPDLPADLRPMGGLGEGLGPPIPARNLAAGTPARPDMPHPGRQAPRTFHNLGARAYFAYGEYEVNRMIA